MAQKVSDVMTSDPVTLPREAPLVIEGDSAEGIVTDRDIVVRGVADGRDPNTVQLGDVLSGDLTAVSPNDSVDHAVQLMRQKAIRRLPVVEAGRPVGIVSLGDLAMERDEGSVLADISEEPPNV
jgi:CBS domain-containing protein